MFFTFKLQTEIQELKTHIKKVIILFLSFLDENAAQMRNSYFLWPFAENENY